MDIKTFYSNIEYQVIENKQVKLIIESGDASLLSASVVALEGQGQIGQLGSDDKLEIDLGLGRDLKGKKLRSISMVADLVGGANMTRISYTLKGGSGTPNFDAEIPVDKEKDVAIYWAQITFV